MKIDANGSNLNLDKINSDIPINLEFVDNLNLENFDNYEDLFSDGRGNGSDIYFFDSDTAAEMLNNGEIEEEDLDHYIRGEKDGEQIIVSREDKLNRLSGKNVFLCRSGRNGREKKIEKLNLSKTKFQSISEDRYRSLILTSFKVLNLARKRLQEEEKTRNELNEERSKILLDKKFTKNKDLDYDKEYQKEFLENINKISTNVFDTIKQEEEHFFEGERILSSQSKEKSEYLVEKSRESIKNYFRRHHVYPILPIVV